ncbi:TetR/AcrR family transcriptional regulator [Streptosporangium saharense]|uniref:TetR/AcrR family transcriptional regulator n=1 Tax=Streptosporangium saharense TaxID=1706840 RepID=UPI003440F8A2
MAEETQKRRAVGRPPGRPSRISRRAIADAALAVGFDNLTLSTVGKQLNISHSALYRHIADREDLVILAIDRVLQRTEWPDPTGEWRADLREEAWTVWRLLNAHPGLVQEFLRLTRYPPEIMRRFAEIVQRLIDHGFTADDAFLAADTVYDLTVDVFSRGQQLDRRAGGVPFRVSSAEGLPETVSPLLAPLIRTALTEPTEAWFRRKLALVLDGIALSLSPKDPG